MEYYQRIKNLREESERTQKEIAALLNMTQTNYAKIENGRIDISIDNLKKLCYLYQLSADYIIGITNEKKELPKK